MRAGMNRGVEECVFPGGVLLVARASQVLATIPAGRLTFDPASEPVRPDTIYDLASLTKILATTVQVMIFREQGALSLDDPLERWWFDTVPEDKRGLTVRHLLSHASGMTAWIPLFQQLDGFPSGERRSAAARIILDTPLEIRPGRRAVYSDLNFILLGLILEMIGQDRQDALFDRLIAGPLELARTGYRSPDFAWPQPIHEIAPTEDLPRRGGVIRGVVHDDNAAALSGVAGHAGLFGTAGDIWILFHSLRAAFRSETEAGLVKAEALRLFWNRSHLTPGSTWALGFDTPSESGSSAGRFFSTLSVGHLGFTGTSLWYDPERDLTVILLTNRVHPTADNTAIRRFRPYMHDLVVKAVYG